MFRRRQQMDPMWDASTLLFTSSVKKRKESSHPLEAEHSTVNSVC